MRLTRLEATGGAPDEISALRIGIEASNTHIQRLIAPSPSLSPLDLAHQDRLDRARYAEARAEARRTAEAWRQKRRPNGPSSNRGAFSIELGGIFFERELLRASRMRFQFWARSEDALTLGDVVRARVSLRVVPSASTMLAIAALDPPDERERRRATAYLLE